MTETTAIEQKGRSGEKATRAAKNQVELVWFAFAFKKNCWARAHMNDMPLFKDTSYGPDSKSGTCNDLLIPGENILTIEVLHVDTIDFKESAWQVRLEMYEVTNIDKPHERMKRNTRRNIRFPHEMYPSVEPRFQRVPFFYRETLDLSGANIPPPPWWTAKDADFGHEGTPELRDAVQRFHAAIGGTSSQRFMDESSLMLQHRERSHGGHEAYLANDGRTFIEDFMRKRPRPRPLDFNELHFEPLHNGRVAKVTRVDGAWTIDAPCEQDPSYSLECDLLLTQVDGTWRVFC